MTKKSAKETKYAIEYHFDFYRYYNYYKKKCTYYYQYENPLVVPYSYLVLLLLHHSLQMAKDSPWVVLKQ